MANIRTFLKNGKSVSGVQRQGVKPASLGTLAEDGRIYQHPRLQLNRIQGSSVRVTNPKAAQNLMNQRIGSIGANAAGQQKRYNQS